MDCNSRRSFLKNVAVGSLSLGPVAGLQPSNAASLSDTENLDGGKGHGSTLLATDHRPCEWSFVSSKTYSDPFNDVELDVVVTDPQGHEQRVPAFWAGDHVWRVRYASHGPGRYSFRTTCSDPKNSDLHGKTGTLEVSPYKGDNPLFLHGPIRVASDRLHFEHEDGTPFFWLGDTWWFGFCTRLPWPEGFQVLTEDRVKKGYTVIQIVAGLYPETTGGGASPFDPRGNNEAGYCWEEKYARINPRYFDMADLRLQHLVERGLLPCVVGSWGYHLPPMGVAKMKQHWRNIIARWGAYPVVWCIAGELMMPYWSPRTKDELAELEKRGMTIADRREADRAFQKHGYTEVGKYIRSTDPYHRLLTLHPQAMISPRVQTEDVTILDFDMLQTTHDDWWGMPGSLELLTSELAQSPRMPVLVGEVVYEGLQQHNRQEVIRFAFWTSMLSGEAGHTYGAGGIFEMEARDQPYGLTADGDFHSYGDLPWDVAYLFPGAQQVAWGKQLLARYEWWRLEPHPEWVEPHWTKEDYMLPYAASIPGELYIVFMPQLTRAKPRSLHQFSMPTIKKLNPNVTYEALWFNPATGKEFPIGKAAPAPDGTWQPPDPDDMVDWVLVVEKPGVRKSQT
jgi:hypothetical protein